MVSQPPDVLVVYEAGGNAVRPIALNVAPSWNAASPAYSVRIRVGDSTWKRALPDVTAVGLGPPLAARPPPDTASVASRTATATVAPRLNVCVLNGRSVLEG
jgi:hypothetical protein